MTTIMSNEVTGETFAFGPRDAEVLAFDWTLDVGSASPRHVHPDQQERFAVTAGVLEIEQDGEVLTLSAGDEHLVPAGVGHRVRSVGEEPVRARVEVRPALGLQGFFEELAALGAGGSMPRNPLRIAPVFADHQQDIRLAGVPAGMQRALLAPFRTRR